MTEWLVLVLFFGIAAILVGVFDIMFKVEKILKILTTPKSEPTPTVFPKGQVPGKVFAPGVYHIDKAHENKAIDATDSHPEPWTLEDVTSEV